MTSRRYALHELSAYHERRRTLLPRSIQWHHFAIGAVLVGLPTAAIIAALVGWLG